MSGIKTNNLEPGQGQQILSEVKSRIQLALQSPVHLLPRQPLEASILPNVPQIDVSVLVNSIINLARLEKDVLFNKADSVIIPATDTTTNPNNLNGDQIIHNLETQESNNVKGLPFPSLPASLTSLPNTVPGVASQLVGIITLPKLSVNIATAGLLRTML